MGCFAIFSQTDSTLLYNNFQYRFLNEIHVIDSVSDNNRIKYIRLKYRVLKVYPYIDTIRSILTVVDNDLKGLSKKRFSKRYIRKAQKKMINQFGTSIARLSRKEGVVLSKLVFREFGVTAYDLIRSYRGRVHAYFWQRLSIIYDGNLKSQFDPKNNTEDMLINYIIQNYKM